MESEVKSWPPHGPKQINKHTCFWQLTSLSGQDRHRAMPATGSEATFARRENYTKISFVKQIVARNGDGNRAAHAFRNVSLLSSPQPADAILVNVHFGFIVSP